MEKNVGSIDLEELKRAREELMQERGLTEEAPASSFEPADDVVEPVQTDSYESVEQESPIDNPNVSRVFERQEAKPVEQKQDTKTAFSQEIKQEQERIKKVYLQFDITNQNLVNTLNEIFSSYPGKSPVFVQYIRKLYPLNLNVEPTNAMVAEISRIVGQDNIKIM